MPLLKLGNLPLWEAPLLPMVAVMLVRARSNIKDHQTLPILIEVCLRVSACRPSARCASKRDDGIRNHVGSPLAQIRGGY